MIQGGVAPLLERNRSRSGGCTDTVNASLSMHRPLYLRKGSSSLGERSPHLGILVRRSFRSYPGPCGQFKVLPTTVFVIASHSRAGSLTSCLGPKKKGVQAGAPTKNAPSCLPRYCKNIKKTGLAGFSGFSGLGKPCDCHPWILHSCLP